MLSSALRRHEHLETAQSRHHQIEEHEIESLGSGQCERRRPVLGGRHPISFTLQLARQQIAVRRIVVDDEDPARDARLDWEYRPRRAALSSAAHCRRCRSVGAAAASTDPVDFPEKAIGKVEHLGRDRAAERSARFHRALRRAARHIP